MASPSFPLSALSNSGPLFLHAAHFMLCGLLLAYPSGLSGKEKGEGKLVGKRNGGSEYPQRAIKRRTEICEDQIDLEILMLVYLSTLII